MKHSEEKNQFSDKPWPCNPMVTLIREHSTEIIQDVITQYQSKSQFTLSPFDLTIQVMIYACSYQPHEVWLGLPKTLDVVKKLIAQNKISEATGILTTALNSGQIHLNKELIKAIAQTQIKVLHSLAVSYHESIDVNVFHERMRKYFSKDAKISLLRFSTHINTDGMFSATAEEVITKKKIYFRPVDLALSKSISELFHYLHHARLDDVYAFGAFLEDDNVPFAWVSYSPVGRKYKKNILKAAGLNPNTTLELTRAWNCEYSPKNAMSVLYSFSHSNLQYLWQKENKMELKAILTAVNPNLGFRGSAFRAVGFGIIGHKPTEYHYIINPSGKRTFVTRRKLTTILKQKDLYQISHVKAAFPLLTTKELAVILRGKTRLTPKSVFYKVTSTEYEKEITHTR